MITGSLVAIVTPMLEDGRLDLARFKNLIDWHIAQGTAAIVVVGTTGESPTVDFDEQKDLYRIVLAAQEAAIKAAKPGNKTSDIEKASEEVVKAELLKLGLITDTKGEQFRTFYTHGICHWIGMDVHDVGDYKLPLQPGMAFVIEPGIYVREAALENLPQTPENKAFIEKAKPAVQKYKNLGVRLEDSFLLSESGLKRLSSGVPRTIEEIESFLKRERTPTQQ